MSCDMAERANVIKVIDHNGGSLVLDNIVLERDIILFFTLSTRCSGCVDFDVLWFGSSFSKLGWYRSGPVVVCCESDGEEVVG